MDLVFISSPTHIICEVFKRHRFPPRVSGERAEVGTILKVPAIFRIYLDFASIFPTAGSTFKAIFHQSSPLRAGSVSSPHLREAISMRCRSARPSVQYPVPTQNEQSRESSHPSHPSLALGQPPGSCSGFMHTRPIPPHSGHSTTSVFMFTSKHSSLSNDPRNVCIRHMVAGTGILGIPNILPCEIPGGDSPRRLRFDAYILPSYPSRTDRCHFPRGHFSRSHIAK